MTVAATHRGSADDFGTRGEGADPDLAAVAASLHGGLPDVLAVRSLRVPCATADAVAVVQDMGALTRYEQKARTVDVRPGRSRTGRYAVWGKIAGLLPWHREFSYLLHDDGFHSADSTVHGGWRVAGGFVVRELGSGGCEVVHYERYDLPRWAKPARRVLSAYMHRSQRRELRIIHDLAVLRSVEARARREINEPDSDVRR